MNTGAIRKWALGAVALAALALPGAAQAHRQWMLPSATTLSGDEAWVTVDAAVSNDLFYFEHMPMRLDGVKVYAPDGREVAIENPATGHFRSVFDVHLTQQGTYRIVSAMTGVMGSYVLNGETKRLPRGLTKDKLAAAIPAGATDVRTVDMANRNEVFVTLGAPTPVDKTTGVGLEMVPVTHPNDLYAGEKATFRFLLDGKPAAGVAVTVMAGGNRYREDLKAQDLKTGADGTVSVTWPEAGAYWLNAALGGGREGGEGPGAPGAPGAPDGKGPPPPPAGAGKAPGGPAGAPGAMPPRRASYVTVLEVLPN